MPEQPADPIHYDMKIPPEPHPDKQRAEPDPDKQRGPEKPASDEGENTSNSAKNTGVVRGDDKPQAGRGSNPRSEKRIRRRYVFSVAI